MTDKTFFEKSKTPIVVGCLAALLFCVDSLLGPLLFKNGHFMWVAFVTWTVFISTTLQNKIRAVIGFFIGFLAAVGMIYFGKLFRFGIVGISLASVIGVFLFNGLVMYLDYLKKLWVNSIAGIFCGIFLTFSGLGVSLSPDTWGNAGLLLGILMIYGLLGLTCAHFHIWFVNKWQKKKEVQSEEKTKPN